MEGWNVRIKSISAQCVPPNYVSTIYVLIVSKNAHFLNPPTQFNTVLRTVWMVPKSDFACLIFKETWPLHCSKVRVSSDLLSFQTSVLIHTTNYRKPNLSKLDLKMFVWTRVYLSLNMKNKSEINQSSLKWSGSLICITN